jgi:exonuclease III
MQKIPNEKHTRLLQTIQLKFSLVDAFRILHPLKKDFSYVPRDCSKNNRSRIDFFFISRALVPMLTECSIAPVIQNKLFDHRAVFLSFKTIDKKPAIDYISSLTVKNPLTAFIVECVFF